MKKCIDPNCNTFARPLTAAEHDNLLSFNLPRDTAKEIFLTTFKGYCPHHAAKQLKTPPQTLTSYILFSLQKWNPYDQQNFIDGAKYAVCSECHQDLRRDTTDKEEIDAQLMALGVPLPRRLTVQWLSLHALSGFGTCHNCCLEKHIEYEYDASLEMILTDLDKVAAAMMAEIEAPPFGEG